MSWDTNWEQTFREREWGRYPPEELIRFMARNYYSASDRSQIKVLELGCGPGANIWYLAREGFSAHGIDGSATAIKKAEMRLQEDSLKAEFLVGDVISLNDLFRPESFDAVIDIACLQCNRESAIDSIYEQALTVLRPNGRMFSMMVADGSYGDGLGQEIEPRSFIDIAEGPLEGKWVAHFSTFEEVQRRASGFIDVQIEYSTISLNDREKWYKIWVFQGTKPG